MRGSSKLLLVYNFLYFKNKNIPTPITTNPNNNKNTNNGGCSGIPKSKQGRIRINVCKIRATIYTRYFFICQSFLALFFPKKHVPLKKSAPKNKKLTTNHQTKLPKFTPCHH
jgi:hypothetical protein